MERIKKCVIYALSRIKVNLLDVNHNRNLKHHETHVVRNNYTSDYTQTLTNLSVLEYTLERQKRTRERTLLDADRLTQTIKTTDKGHNCQQAREFATIYYK